MKNIRWIILAALIVAAPTASHAQAPAAPAAAGGTADTGTITNAASDTTTTTTTTTSSTGIAPEGEVTDVVATSDTTQLANTGGEPILMSLFGASLALGAFALRRRVTN